jgi:ABC-2 type transport system permease protein
MTSPTSPTAPAPGRPGPTAPGAALRAEYRLLLRTTATRGRVVGVSLLGLLAILTAVLVAANHPDHPLRAGTSLVNGYVGTLLPVAVLVFGAATLGDLVDDGSLVYLWLRPVPAWVHLVAAVAATVTIAVPVMVVPVVVSAAIVSTDASLLSGTVLAGLIGAIAYACMFVVGGIRFRRAMPWGLVYILIWEGFIASAGKTATKLALRSYIRSILSSQTGIHLKLGEFNLAVGILVPLAVAALVGLYGVHRLRATDVP